MNTPRELDFRPGDMLLLVPQNVPGFVAGLTPAAVGVLLQVHGTVGEFLSRTDDSVSVTRRDGTVVTHPLRHVLAWWRDGPRRPFVSRTWDRR